MFEFRSPKNYLRSAIIYSVLLLIAGSVLLYTLMDLRYEQIPFKEETDNLHKTLIELKYASTQFMNVDAIEEEFYLNEPAKYLPIFYSKDRELESTLLKALDNKIVINNEQLSIALETVLANNKLHLEQFNHIADLYYYRGNKDYTGIGALRNATKVIEFFSSFISDKQFTILVLQMEIHVNEYLLYKDEKSLDSAFNIFDTLKAKVPEYEDEEFDSYQYYILLDSYKVELENIKQIDDLLGLNSKSGELQKLDIIRNDLELSLEKATTSLTRVINNNMNSSLLIIIISLFIIVLITITFVLQNRAFIATQLAKEKTEETLEFVSNYDANTGLPNQKMYEKIVDNHLSSMTEPRNTALIIAIGFKEVSDLTKIYGLNGIQKLQNMISERLRKNSENSKIGVMDAGQFNIFKESCNSIYEDINDCEELISVLSAPYTLNDELVYLTPQLGIATSPEDAIVALDLIEKASVALTSVQNQLGQTMGMYNTSLSKSTKERVELITSMRQAIDNDEFFLVYQPIIDLKTNKMMGTEALIRWIKPNGDFISPGVFIPIAEETGLIIPISNWVVKESFKQSALWKSKGLDLRISVNLSALQFSDGNLLSLLENTLKETNADPKMIALELTEYSLLTDEDNTLEILNEIKKMGFTIYLDDFGTGYSSLSYVHKLPIDTLKVDREFIKDYPEKQDTTILAVVYELSRQFKMKVVVEGIETEEQNKLVKNLGCEYAQGYLYSKPTSAEIVEELFSKN